jgi:DNA mismatch repair ATPase MutL
MINENGDAPRPAAMGSHGTVIQVKDLFYNNP